MATIDYNLTVDELVEQYQELDDDDSKNFRETLGLKDPDNDTEEEEEEDDGDQVEAVYNKITTLDEDQQEELLSNHYAFAEYARPTADEMSGMLDRMDKDEKKEFLEDIGNSQPVPDIHPTLRRMADEFTEDQLEQIYKAAKKIIQ